MLCQCQGALNYNKLRQINITDNFINSCKEVRQKARKIDRQLDSEIDGKIYRQLDSEIDGKIYRQIDTQINRKIDNHLQRKRILRWYGTTSLTDFCYTNFSNLAFNIYQI